MSEHVAGAPPRAAGAAEDPSAGAAGPEPGVTAQPAPAQPAPAQPAPAQPAPAQPATAPATAQPATAQPATAQPAPAEPAPAQPATEERVELPAGRGPVVVLLASVFIIAICGLIYELIFGALSTYLLGSSITQFSIVIGVYLTAMGIGSFLSRLFTRELLRGFLIIELLVGVVGGASSLLLFVAYAVLHAYLPVLIGVALLVGALVGLEIPLLVRILGGQASLRATLGNVLAIDYLGALGASLLFPLLLVPHLGLVRTSFLFGLLNVGVGLLGLQLFARQVRGARALRAVGLLCAAAMLAGLLTAGRTTTLLEDMLYDDPVVYSRSTPYQRLVITRWRDDLRLFIDGNLQFSSTDEHRYHEALVHPALSLAGCPRLVLMLGGGDGLAAREALKHRCLERLDLVDLDPEMTRIFSRLPLLTELNRGALSDPRVHVHNEDAQKFLERSRERYDAILIDLPDPNNEGLGRLYTRSFYRLVAGHLTRGGVVVTQATSPFYSTEAYWCIANTMASATSGPASLQVLPYHASVPSFGEWGFVLGALRPLAPGAIRLEIPTRYLTQELLPTLFVFPGDLARRATAINRLDDQVLVRLYAKGYRRYNR